MKKIVMSLVFAGLLCSSVYSFDFGLEFQAGENILIGTNMRFTDQFELKPQLGFLFSDPTDLFLLAVDANYYLPQLGNLDHYLGGGINLGIVSEGDETFGINGHYGLRYGINEIVSIFGQIGLNFVFTPDFAMNTTSSALGVTFFIIRK